MFFPKKEKNRDSHYWKTHRPTHNLWGNHPGVVEFESPGQCTTIASSFDFHLFSSLMGHPTSIIWWHAVCTRELAYNNFEHRLPKNEKNREWRRWTAFGDLFYQSSPWWPTAAMEAEAVAAMVAAVSIVFDASGDRRKETLMVRRRCQFQWRVLLSSHVAGTCTVRQFPPNTFNEQPRNINSNLY